MPESEVVFNDIVSTKRLLESDDEDGGSSKRLKLDNKAIPVQQSKAAPNDLKAAESNDDVAEEVHNGLDKTSNDEAISTDITSSSKSSIVNGTDQGSRNPLAILNQLRNGLKYNVVDRTGPSHAPTFKVSVLVDGCEYTGTGTSKKLAKSNAAAAALQSFIQFKDTNVMVSSLPSKATDFTQDAVPWEGNALQRRDSSSNTKGSPVIKTSLMLLNEMFPNATFKYEENSNDMYNRFKAIATVGNEEFVGSGCRKQSAKNAAATAALSKLCGRSPSLNTKVVSLFTTNNITVEQQQLANHIASLVNDTFTELLRHDAKHVKRKVIAGIVMTRGDALDTAKLISVATGTKCISGEYLSVSGTSLNDMHAEIINRRCLMLYWIHELQKVFSHDESSIFEWDESQIKLKDDVQFHLYINTAPCGDARIFSPHETTESTDAHPHRTSRGLLRTKVESGEGTIPIKSPLPVQTWDGVLQGERLLTMSCSDKIARWNVLGLQGAMLSHILEPIYLKSIVLGSLMNHSHLHRAICGRMEGSLQGLPPPYRLNRPQMLCTSSTEPRMATKAPSFSVNWYEGCNRIEIINTITGKPNNGVSRLCKQSIMKEFVALLKDFNKEMDLPFDPNGTYGDIKRLAHDYQIAKVQLADAFAKEQLGAWVKKPMEQDQFCIGKQTDST